MLSHDLRLTYYHDPRIHRRIRYGPAEREYLDIYAPWRMIHSSQGWSHDTTATTGHTRRRYTTLCLSMSIYIFLYIYICICMSIYIYVYIYIYVCLYIFLYIGRYIDALKPSLRPGSQGGVGERCESSSLSTVPGYRGIGLVEGWTG